MKPKEVLHLYRCSTHTHTHTHTILFNFSILHHLLCLSFLPRPRYNIWSIWCLLLEEVVLWGYPVLSLTISKDACPSQWAQGGLATAISAVGQAMEVLHGVLRATRSRDRKAGSMGFFLQCKLTNSNISC